MRGSPPREKLADSSAQEGAQSVVDHVVSFCLPQSKEVLGAFNTQTQQNAEGSGSKNPPFPAPTPWQHIAAQKPRRVEQDCIHKIAAQKLRVLTCHDGSVGVKGKQLRFRTIEAAAACKGSGYDDSKPDNQKKRYNRFPKSPVFKAAAQTEIYAT